MQLTLKEKADLLPELRKIYGICEENGYTPSETFVKLGKVLKAESTARATPENDEAEFLYQNQSRTEIDEWLEAIESNIENERSGGTLYRDNEKQFVEDMRGRFCEKADWAKPLTGKQLKWLKSLYDKS
jgi:hypothetical protein